MKCLGLPRCAFRRNKAGWQVGGSLPRDASGNHASRYLPTSVVRRQINHAEAVSCLPVIKDEIEVRPRCRRPACYNFFRPRRHPPMAKTAESIGPIPPAEPLALKPRNARGETRERGGRDFFFKEIYGNLGLRTLLILETKPTRI